MKTQLLYLENSYLKEMDAVVLEVIPDGSGWKIILDKSVFYPMGGGQPTDQGTITSDSWKGDVYQVLMKDGEIWHYVKALSVPTIGMKLHGVINWERRYKNMQVHSAGHIVDFAMYLLDYSPNTLMPFKGDHGKKPYIVYIGELKEDIKQKLEDKANELVKKDLKFTTLFQPFKNLQKEAIYLQPGLPLNKPLRTLRLETVGAVADGGTQVRSTKEVGKIIIPLIENKDGNTVVNYFVAPLSS
ncbi:alanyl-tRNA editing protein [Candidatus Roizmanbacteria bacterium]|nr:alanyl-tRNA editing protein [Candidatus Roizmanbacteria bacterium]